MYTSSILWNKQAVFRKIYAYSFLYTITIRERDKGFEEEQEDVFVKVWKEEKT